MDAWIVSSVSLAIMFLLLASGLWVAMAMIGTGLICLLLFKDVPTGTVFASTAWGSTSVWSLTALPMFIWMGEILYRSKISEDMFHGLAPLANPLPGGLLHVNVLACGIFAAVCGSSTATAATIGRMTLPELRQRGYDEAASIGSLSGAATLGLLIPPSIAMIVYGVVAQVSIAALFMAGVLPGLMLMAMMMMYIAVWARINSSKMPPPDPHTSFREKLVTTMRLLPVAGLIVAVLGSIYSGIATPTEAACVGIVGALVISWLSRSLSKQAFIDSLVGATRTTCFIGFLIAGASYLAVAMGFTGVPGHLARGLGSFNLSAGELLVALYLLFIVLGCFLDGISMVLLTAAVILPLVTAAGIDLLWFGIFIVIVYEVAQITPPVGFNLFVIQRLTNHDIFFTARASLPYFVLLSAAILILAWFPSIVTWLPRRL